MNQREKVWNLEEIKEYITNDQEQEIMEIPICRSGGRDRIIWPHIINGEYTVKNGYHCLKNKEVEGRKSKPSGSHRIEEAIWKEIWNLPVPRKVRHFMWKACGNWLATNHNLRRKRIRQSAICPICEKEEETIEHVLLQCEWTLSVWYGLDIGYKVDRQRIKSFDR